jgi:hypothetical protein
MNKAICVRLSQVTDEKLKQLIDRYGTQTQAIAFAIDELWQKEFGGKIEKRAES